MDHEIYSAKLQSRVTWASKGDATTKYFHAVASARKNHNAIWSLQDERGTWVSDDLSIKSLGTSYFRQIFEDDHLTNLATQLKILHLFPSFISSSEDEAFTRLVSISEVEYALKSFKKDKALGPDGWPVEFYLTFLDLLGRLLVNLVESSRVLGRVAPAINSTFLALIPKVDLPVSFADYRPISLCNLCYKLISKIAALRLKPFLDASISPQQFVFLKKRQILEPIAIT